MTSYAPAGPRGGLGGGLLGRAHQPAGGPVLGRFGVGKRLGGRPLWLAGVHRLFEQRQDLRVQRASVRVRERLDPLLQGFGETDTHVHDLLSHAASVARPDQIVAQRLLWGP